MSTASPSHKDVSDSAATETIESFTDSAVALAESLGAPEHVVNDFEESARDLAGLVEGIAQQSAQAQERAREAEARVEKVEDELAEERERSARERADVRADLHEVRESVEQSQDGSEESDSNPAERDETPTPQAGSPPTQAPETSLGQAIRLPKHVAEENLTENQQRARSVAKDIHEYATSVPAGYRLSASEMRRVLSAQEDGATIHGQTLARVRDFLVRLGGEHVELKESRSGTTSVIFDAGFVKRVVAWSNENGGHGAVTRGGVSG